ncbi:MAG: polyprenyl synthetase family protein [Candidatus Sericytochromatia bacterium]
MSIFNTYKTIDGFVKIEKEFKTDLLKVEKQLDLLIEKQPEWFQEVINHLVKAGGKRIRPLLVFLSYSLVSKKELDNTVILLAALAEFVHSATLFHDDVIDDGVERRGKPTANKIYGNHTAILSGDFILGKVFQEINLINNPKILTEMIDTVVKLVDGEIHQMDMKRKDFVSFEDYERLIYLKTASLFEWCMTAGGYSANVDNKTIEDLRKIGNHIGKIFQIVDDILDYTGSNLLGKKRLQDFSQGKITLPLLFVFKSDINLFHEWKTLIRENNESNLEKFGKKIISIIGKDILQKEMKDYLQKEIDGIKETINIFENSKYKSFMNDLIEFLIARMT